MMLSALSSGTGSGGLPLPLRANSLPGVWGLSSALVPADFDDCISPEVEHTGKASVADSFLLVEVSDSLDGFFRDRGIVVGSANAEAALVESDYFRFFARAGRLLKLLVFLAQRAAIFGCFAYMNFCCALDLNGITSIPFGVVHRQPC